MSSLIMKQVIDNLPICSINLVTMAQRLAAQFATNKIGYPSNTIETAVMFSTCIVIKAVWWVYGY